MTYILDLRNAKTCANSSLSYNLRMVERLKLIGGVLFLLAILDLFFLGLSLLQIAAEGQTGMWAPFWQAQADFLFKFI